MTRSPARLQTLFLWATAIALARCTPGADPTPAAPGALRGELVIYTATFDDGTTEHQYALRAAGDDGDERRLLFPTPPELPSGTLIDVWGDAEPRGDGLMVTRVEPVRGRGGEIEATAQPLIQGGA